MSTSSVELVNFCKMTTSRESVITFQNHLASIMDILLKNAVSEITRLFESSLAEMHSVSVTPRQMEMGASRLKHQQLNETAETDAEFCVSSGSNKTEFEAWEENLCAGTIDVFGHLVAHDNGNATKTSSATTEKPISDSRSEGRDSDQRWNCDVWRDGDDPDSDATMNTHPVEVKLETPELDSCCSACGKLPISAGSLCDACTTFRHQGAQINCQMMSVLQPGSVLAAREDDNGNACHSSCAVTPFENVPIFNIREILLVQAEGESIVRNLEEHHCLNRQRKNQMVRILVRHLMERFGETPSSQIKKALASALVTEFPCLKDLQGEGYELWYSQGKHHHPATGFLEERLRNTRKRLRRQSRERSSSSHVENGGLGESSVPQDSMVSAERAFQMTEWLKHNTEPLCQVWEFMRQTAIHRANWIRQNGPKQMGEILQEYPHLLATPGMISQDFDVLHESCADRLLERWVPVFAEKILLFATNEKRIEKFKQAGSTVGDLALKLLPTILPPLGCKAGRKMCRLSFEEAKKSFIDWKPASTNMAEYLRQAEAERPYPFVLQLGSSQTFAIVHGQALQQGALLNAVDFCFKAFHCFQISFPKQCAPAWEFLQHGVYGIAHGKPAANVRALLNWIFAD